MFEQEAQAEMPTVWRGWVWEGGHSPLDLKARAIAALPLSCGEVLVRNAAIGLNPVDWKVLDTQKGKVPGVDGAGVVVAVGPAVESCWLGARVAYHQSLKAPGSFAEYTPVAAQVLMRLPDAMEFAQGAAFPCPALTAWQALEKIPAQPGAPLLVSGAGGSVGHFLIQLAQMRGFEVTAIAHDRHWSRLRALGAAHCIADPLAHSPTLPAALMQRYFAVIDAVSPEHAAGLADGLKANGHLVCIQGRVESWPCSPFGRALSLHEVALGALHIHGDSAQWQALTQQGERMLMQIVQGAMQSEQLLHFSFNQLPQHLVALKNRDFSGKQVLVF